MVKAHDCMVRAHVVNALADLLGSKVKAEVFRLLFGVGDERLHLRELARQSGLAVGTVRQELKRLTRLGVVEAEADGNRTYYRANEAHPLFPGINSLVLKTVGVVDVLREALRDAQVRMTVPAAGSTEQLEQELELMVIGQIAKRQLEKRLGGGVNVDEVHAGVGELAELVEAVAAVDDAGVHQRGGPAGGLGLRRVFLDPGGVAGGVRRIRNVFPSHGARIERRATSVNPGGQGCLANGRTRYRIQW